jgi:hypothetical protein
LNLRDKGPAAFPTLIVRQGPNGLIVDNFLPAKLAGERNDSLPLLSEDVLRLLLKRKAGEMDDAEPPAKKPATATREPLVDMTMYEDTMLFDSLSLLTKQVQDSRVRLLLARRPLLRATVHAQPAEPVHQIAVSRRRRARIAE